MKPSHFAVLLGAAALIATTPLQARDHHKPKRSDHRFRTGMRVIPTHTVAGQPGHGWRYFCDARESRAVVISPEGDYFYSEGNGLNLVRKGSGTA